MSHERTLITGMAANVAGLLVGIAALLGVQILLGRTLEPGAFGAVTVAVTVAFVAAAGSRFGMDMAAVRLVAIGRGADAAATSGASSSGARSSRSPAASSSPSCSPRRRRSTGTTRGPSRSRPWSAVHRATNVYLGATRGLVQMRQTLYVFWIGQPVAWIAIAGAAIAAGGEEDAVILAYDASWLLAAVAAWALWRREAAGFADRPATREEVRAAVHYGVPRAPSALLAQAVFWADLWVLAAFEDGSDVGPTRPPPASPRCCCSS